VADEELDVRARLAVLKVMGWPDDRNAPRPCPGADGVPPRAHWNLAGELVAAVAPLVLRKVADEHELIVSAPGIWPTATAWMRHRADNWPDLEVHSDSTTTDQETQP
jgi:hypothetical protein